MASPPPPDPERSATPGEGSAPRLEDVYEDLRGLASALFHRGGPGHTLQPTALVHEVWLRVADREAKDRQHFLAVAARAMRQILIDHARKARADKRGGGGNRVTLGPDAELGSDSSFELIALDDALAKLGKANPRYVQVFELRFLAGMDSAEVAEVLGVTQRTVQLDWRAMRAFLQRELLEDRDAK